MYLNINQLIPKWDFHVPEPGDWKRTLASSRVVFEAANAFQNAPEPSASRLVLGGRRGGGSPAVDEELSRRVLNVFTCRQVELVVSAGRGRYREKDVCTTRLILVHYLWIYIYKIVYTYQWQAIK